MDDGMLRVIDLPQLIDVYSVRAAVLTRANKLTISCIIDKFRMAGKSWLDLGERWEWATELSNCVDANYV